MAGEREVLARCSLTIASVRPSKLGTAAAAVYQAARGFIDSRATNATPCITFSNALDGGVKMEESWEHFRLLDAVTP
jgi:hypothetical protein